MSDTPNAVLDRLHIIPIIQDNSNRKVYFGDPDNPAAWLGQPDRVVGYRFYVEKDGIRNIIETRSDACSDYNLVSVYYLDWADSELERKEVDSDSSAMHDVIGRP